MTLLHPQQTPVLLLFFFKSEKNVLENCKCAFDFAKMCSLAICKNSETSELTSRENSLVKKNLHTQIKNGELQLETVQFVKSNFKVENLGLNYGNKVKNHRRQH